MGWDLFERAASRVVRVALPVPVDRAFDYEVPEDLAREAEVGRRVRAPFQGRRLTGVIVETGVAPELPDGARLRALESILDPTPALPAPLLAALVEEAAATLCPLGVALAAALPPGATPMSERGFALTARGREALASGAAAGDAKSVLEALAEGPRSAVGLARATRATPAQLAGLERERLIARTLIERGPRARPARVRVACLTPGIDAEAEAAKLARAPRQAALLRALAAEGETATAALAARVPGAAGALRALARRGLIAIEEREVALASAFAAHAPAVELTPEQREACAAIGAAVGERRSETFLLHGVTGSGKTEVYLRAVAEALALGRQALVLVPEIPLTHQILARLRGRFGDAPRRAPQRPHAERAPRAVGAPPPRRGADRGGRALRALRADARPRRDRDGRGARRVLQERGRLPLPRAEPRRAARAPRALPAACSAPPRPRSRRATPPSSGRIQRLRLAHRIGGRPLPAVEVVDLARERARHPRGRKLILSSLLLRALRETARAGRPEHPVPEPARLLDPDRLRRLRARRCAASTATSRSPTTRARTRSAATTATAHTPPPERCPGCGSEKTALLGVGTERVEEEVRAQLPEARVARLDRDTAGRRGAVGERAARASRAARSTC